MNVKQNHNKAGLYVSISNKELRLPYHESTENQTAFLKQFCKANNLIEVEVYCDDGFSDTDFYRPGLEKMIEDLDTGHINAVITKNLSRFGDSYLGTSYYIERIFEEKNFRFILCDEDVDMLYFSKAQDLFMPIKNMIKSGYSQKISKKTKAAFYAKAELGQYFASKAPFGYIKSPENKYKLVIDKEAADIVALIYKLFYEGYSQRNITDYLNERMVLTPINYYIKKNPEFYKDKKENEKSIWATKSVSTILKNPVYTGTLVYGKQKITDISSHKLIKQQSSELVIKNNTHEAIVSQEVWDGVQEKLKALKRKYDYLNRT